MAEIDWIAEIEEDRRIRRAVAEKLAAMKAEAVTAAQRELGRDRG